MRCQFAHPRRILPSCAPQGDQQGTRTSPSQRRRCEVTSIPASATGVRCRPTGRRLERLGRGIGLCCEAGSLFCGVIAKEKEVTKIERVCPLPRSPRSEERADGERQDGEVVTKARRLKTESGRMAKQQVRDSNTAIGTARRGAKRTSRPLSFVSHAS